MLFLLMNRETNAANVSDATMEEFAGICVIRMAIRTTSNERRLWIVFLVD